MNSVSANRKTRPRVGATSPGACRSERIKQRLAEQWEREFQKAELRRNREDWGTISDLMGADGW